MKPGSPRIVVVGPSWVGDMVMAQSLFMTLKAKHPDAYLAVIAPAWTEPLLARMPEIDASLPADFRHGRLGLGERVTQARALRRQHFDQAIVLPRSIKSALAPWLAGIPRRTGYLGEMRYGLINDVRPLDKSRLPLTVQRFVYLAAEPGAAADVTYPLPRFAVDAGRRAAALESVGVAPPAGALLVLCPGAEYGAAKRWPVHHFATLARLAAEAGYAVWLLGSARDRATTTAVAAAAGAACVDLAGRTGLGEAIDLMSLADAVVSNDSGLMHVAAALDRPLVALFGSSSPKFTPPLSPKAKVISLGLECSPCFQRECPLGHLRCLEDIDPERVFAAINAPCASTAAFAATPGSV